MYTGLKDTIRLYLAHQEIVGCNKYTQIFIYAKNMF